MKLDRYGVNVQKNKSYARSDAGSQATRGITAGNEPTTTTTTAAATSMYGNRNKNEREGLDS